MFYRSAFGSGGERPYGFHGGVQAVVQTMVPTTGAMSWMKNETKIFIQRRVYGISRADYTERVAVSRRTH
jgi:hypothetical protein